MRDFSLSSGCRIWKSPLNLAMSEFAADSSIITPMDEIDLLTGQPHRITDNNGGVTTRTFDAFGRVRSVAALRAGGITAPESYYYTTPHCCN